MRVPDRIAPPNPLQAPPLLPFSGPSPVAPPAATDRLSLSAAAAPPPARPSPPSPRSVAPPPSPAPAAAPARPATPAVLLDEAPPPAAPTAGHDLRMALGGVTTGSGTKVSMPLATRPVRMELERPTEAAAPTLTRLERNLPMLGVSGAVLVRSHVPGLTVDVPHAAVLGKAVANQLPVDALSDANMTHVHIVPDLTAVQRLAASPSGRADRAWGRNVVVDTDRASGFREIFLTPDALRPDFTLAAAADRAPFRAADPRPVDLPRLAPRPVETKVGPDASVFCGGLISISAEPPEGFFAASTAMELGAQGHPSRPAAEADVWIYRVPDSRRTSYFDFTFAAPDRPSDTPRGDKFKIATGVGPASDPTSSGGAEADLLWLGDEQHGALQAYLQTLARPGATVDDLAQHKGLIHRLSDTEVLLSGADQAHAMTKEGFNALKTDPGLYRRVYSAEYDTYLRGLFSHPPDEQPARASYLLATSRGCTQGCTLCSSGGLKAFQFFTAPRMMEELEKIARHADVREGEVIDVFLLDSNLNNNPERLVELADLYEKSPLHGTFRFYCRHSTPNGFLKMQADGTKAPNGALINAYKRLGLTQVFMGIDTYDDNSTLTLKSNRLQVARKGDQVRPTYRADEIRALISEMEKAGLESKGFLLTNNPWVGDLDRIDAWYNVHELWLDNPHFSVDSRTRDVMRLKPFEGSPIEKVTTQRGLEVLDGSRFAARGVLGEIDEIMSFTGVGTPRARGDAAAALDEFAAGLARIRSAAEQRFTDPATPPADREKAGQIIRKLIARDASMRPQLARERAAGVGGAARLLEQQRAFAERHADLPPLRPEEQRAAFLKAAESLFDGLRDVLPIKMERAS